MAFVPVVSGSTITLGTSNSPMQFVGQNMFAGGTYSLRHTTSGTYTMGTGYEVTPRNWLWENVPVLVVGQWDFNAFPWFVRYVYTWSNIQQNGRDNFAVGINAFCHATQTNATINQTTTYYADGTAPIKVNLLSYNNWTTFATVTHDIYRIGV